MVYITPKLETVQSLLGTYEIDQFIPEAKYTLLKYKVNGIQKGLNQSYRAFYLRGCYTLFYQGH
jgi:hypothetical protein